ncbi:MAG: Ig-like domain-containing protein [Pseudomonadota bacterium]
MKNTSMGKGLLMAAVTVMFSLLIGAVPAPVFANITVAVSGPGGTQTRSLPDAGGVFDLNMPLSRNAVNAITVTARDSSGNSASQELSVTQVSLDQIVVAKITSERLSVEEVEQLVASGVIQLDDPQNFNVSNFVIVLTIGKKPVTFSVPIAIPIGNQTSGGYEAIKLLFGNDSGGAQKTQQPIQIIAFDEPVESPPGEPPVPSIPGVIIIEGNIKTLKEFFNVRLLLMNRSGIFTLSDVSARIVLPEGDLSTVLPADGVNSFGDILPGTGDQPGQKEMEFIIRGDTVGIHDVAVNFGGSVSGPGITNPIPFNGRAETSVEVKGPPSLAVQVFHPYQVEAGVPYDLVVEITNTGDLPALYTSLDLSVDADAAIYFCNADAGGSPVCGFGDGPATRSFGHIQPGAMVSGIFSIKPGKTGIISSCMAAADQNISLQVLVGAIGCMVGTFPPDQAGGSGNVSVHVLPAPNAFGIHEDSPVTAFFSRKMNQSSITTGAIGSFNVYAGSDVRVPGKIRFETMNEGTDNEKTVAIWQVNDGITNRLAPNATYTIVLSRTISDLSGNTLAGKYESEFTTTDTGLSDITLPDITLSVRPPVNPNAVLPGQIIAVNAYASDQGSGIARVELRLKDMDIPGSLFELVGQKTVFSGDLPPYIFSVDSSKLVPGHTYQAMATAYDMAGNAQNGTISLIILTSAAAPTLTLPASLPAQVLHGISITLNPTVTGGVTRVEYFLDSASQPFKTVTLSPWQGSLSTLNLSLGNHTITARATDGLDQTGQATYAFELIQNINMPVVGFSGINDGITYLRGELIHVNGTADDPVGVASMSYYLDGTGGSPIYTGNQPILLDSSGLILGNHTLTIIATNNLGVQNDPADPGSVLEFSVTDAPSGPPPAAPQITSTGAPENGAAVITGTAAATARIDATNTASGLLLSVYADAGGNFTVTMPGQTGNIISLVAYTFATSDKPSSPATTTLGAPKVLTSITVVPDTITFTAVNQTRNVTVTGHYSDSSTANLTGQTTFSSTVQDNPGVAAINSAGTAVALKNGTAVITAAYGGQTAQINITADILTLTHITVAPASINFTTIGQTQQLVVTGHYSNGSTAVLGGTITYMPGNTQTVAVSSSGLVTAKANGVTQISVSHPDAPAVTVPVTVDTGLDPAPTVSILSPADGASVSPGALVTVTVKADDLLGGVTRIEFETTGATVFSDNRQISPPSLSKTVGFQFTVDPGAAVGSTVTVRSWAVDTSSNTSTVSQITLNVIDPSAPVVTITQPAQLTAYNYGDTVNIRVTATDAQGVNRIRYEATGSVSSSGSQTVSGISTSADFSFTIPLGAPTPDVRIQAWARDINNNEGVSTPVDIVITSADITPPATEATAVSNPGGSTSATITYAVTSGLSDLDHVELYFRRDGHGTFNRYTGATGTGDGKYTPQSGSTGTIVFDSTRMGGDGSYDFFTIGVDAAGNREAPPVDAGNTVVADQTRAFAAGTIWTVITTNTVIGPADVSLDNKNIRIDGATLTLEGTHPFHNVEIINGGVLTHPETTAVLAYTLDITAWTLSVNPDSRIAVSGRGFLGGKGYDEPGRTLGNDANGSASGAGGSFGGIGGSHDGALPNPVYGDLTNPVDPGSGGGAWDSYDGGDGGGFIKMTAINLVVDGIMAATGGESAGAAAGDGSGGGINLTTRSLSGSGSINADGGGQSTATAGGGGRIAVRYLDMAFMDMDAITALGGYGYYANGANGTVYLKQENETNGALVITGHGPGSPWTQLTIPGAYTFDIITLTNQARVLADTPVIITGLLHITGDSILSHTQGSEGGLSITADTVRIDGGSAIDVTGRGYRGGLDYDEPGHTRGDIEGSQTGGGGSFGGLGGGHEGRDSYTVYGDPKLPVELGSGGGAWDSYDGGCGGGRITITAATAVIVNGALLANGGESAGAAAGDGSGGSILIRTSRLAGTGAIQANGGGGYTGTAGGGGRIAIECDYVSPVDNLGDLRSITAASGRGYYNARPAAAGTVLIRYSGQENGDLYIDDTVVDGSGYPNGTSSSSTHLTPIGFGLSGAISDQTADGKADTLTADGQVRMVPDGLAGLKLNPDIDQNETFTVLSNTGTTITVTTPNENGIQFSDVAQAGKTYAGSFTFDNLVFRRGGNLMIGDFLTVTHTLTLDEYGLLTHFDATTAFESRLDLTVNTLVIGDTGRIDVTARGYLGGQAYDERGRTTGNVYGSDDGAGGSFGGLGGSHSGAVPNSLYGSLTNPVDTGSGGGAWDSYDGGDGGGRVRITATSATVNGTIRANGGESAGSAAGDGSGGSVSITTHALDGTGFIEANGAGGNTGVGGGGGRVSIACTGPLTLNEAHVHALGGQGYYGGRAGDGTVVFKRAGQTHGELVIDGQGLSPSNNTTFIPGGYTFDSLVLRNNAVAIADNGLTVIDTLLLTGNSTLSHNQGLEAGLSITADTIQIDNGSAIDVTGRGYRGGLDYDEPGHTLGDIEGSQTGAGGSFGGLGGGHEHRDSYTVYGDPKLPAQLGSGGGAWDSYDGGYGGGRITINAATAVIVNGVVLANGGESAGTAAGDGSGGSILIQTSHLSGTGAIHANGGGGYTATAGGGGRVAIFCDDVDPVDNLENGRAITALSGRGYYNDRPAAAGTVFIRTTGQENGNLYIDDNVVDGGGNPNGTSASSTFLTPIGFGIAGTISDQTADGMDDTLITDGEMRMVPNGLVGLRLNPDITQGESFVILGNTADAITVHTPNENGVNFAGVAQTGRTYAGSFTVDNLIFRRGGNLMVGDLLTVSDTVILDEYGLLTHFDATETFTSRLDLTTDTLIIEPTGRIDVTARGYLGGQAYDEHGRTIGNAYGSEDGAGGSYGGLGGSHSGAVPNALYGSPTNPVDNGSGGGSWDSYDGGDGGGRIRITAATAIVNGTIRADGGESAGSAAGDGSGGSINIITHAIDGTGTIEADGGGSGTGVGGGGGRINVTCTGTHTLDGANIHSSGGVGYYSSGHDGSVVYP